MQPPDDPDTWKQIEACCRALDDKKAEGLRVLDVRGLSTVADYYVIASGTSDPHLRALRVAAEKATREAGAELLSANRDSGHGWAVMDAFDFMVHLFTRDARRFYNLEGLWKDAEALEMIDGEWKDVSASALSPRR